VGNTSGTNLKFSEISQGYKQLSIRNLEHEDAIETDLGQTWWVSGNLRR